MRLTSMEKRLCRRYTDAELDRMSWRELGRLSPFHHETIRYRVVKKRMSRRDALSGKRYPTFKKKVSHGKNTSTS